MNYCKCGCGVLVNNEYAKGHARRGKTNSIQHILALKKANTGKKRTNTWNKGKSYEEIFGTVKANRLKKILSEKHMGKKMSKETKEKLSKTNKKRCNTEEYKKKCSENAKGHIVKKETRIKIGIANKGNTFKHSKETKEKISNSSKKMWEKEGYKDNFSKIMINKYINNEINNNTHSWKSGRRKDLNNIFFRSSWEANFARILNYLNIKWEYEPKRFILYDNDKKITYLPDFKIGNYYIEIKGFIKKDKSNIKKFNLFKEQYSDFTSVFIGADEYYSLLNFYKNEVEFE